MPASPFTVLGGYGRPYVILLNILGNGREAIERCLGPYLCENSTRLSEVLLLEFHVRGFAVASQMTAEGVVR